MDTSPFSAILSQLFWLLFIFLAVLPMIRQRMLESARLSLIRQIEKKRGSRVIGLIHCQESLALFGVPLFRFISVEDSEEVLRAICRLTLSCTRQAAWCWQASRLPVRCATTRRRSRRSYPTTRCRVAR